MKRFAFVFMFLLVATAASADVLVFKDGRRIEGEILSERSGEILIRIRRGSSYGRARFGRHLIARIERKLTDFNLHKAEYDILLTSAKKTGTIDAWEKLANWCHDKQFHGQKKKALLEIRELKESKALAIATVDTWKKFLNWCVHKNVSSPKLARRIHERILQLDSNDKTARKALGSVKFKNQWMPRDQWQAAYDADMLSRGFVKYKKTWYSPAGLTAYVKALEVEKLTAALKTMEERNARLRSSVNLLSKNVSKLQWELNQRRKDHDTLILALRQIKNLEYRLLSWGRRVTVIEKRATCTHKP